MAPKAAAPAAGKKKRAALSSEDRAVVAELERLSKTVVHEAERLVASTPAAPVDLVANENLLKTMIHFALYDVLSADLTCGQECVALSRAPRIVAHLNEKYGGRLHDLDWRSAFLKRSKEALLAQFPSQRSEVDDSRTSDKEQELVEKLVLCKKEIKQKIKSLIYTIDSAPLSELRFDMARVDTLLGNYDESDATLRLSLRILGPVYAVPTDKDHDYARRVLSTYVDV